MSKTDLVLKEHSDIFHLFDAEDEQQIIMEAQDRMKDELVYITKKQDLKTKEWKDVEQLSYAGIQHIILMMAQKHDEVGSLELVDDVKVEIKTVEFFINNEMQKISKWFASCKVRNTLTMMATPGVAESDVVVKAVKRDPVTNKKVWNEGKHAYEMVDCYDDFGRNKAVSKAFRNACKLQIPQKLILEMIKIAKGEGKTKTFKNVTSETKETSTEKPEVGPKKTPGVTICECEDLKVQLTIDGKGCKRCQRILDEDKRKRIWDQQGFQK